MPIAESHASGRDVLQVLSQQLDTSGRRSSWLHVDVENDETRCNVSEPGLSQR